MNSAIVTFLPLLKPHAAREKEAEGQEGHRGDATC